MKNASACFDKCEDDADAEDAYDGLKSYMLLHCLGNYIFIYNVLLVFNNQI